MKIYCEILSNSYLKMCDFGKREKALSVLGEACFIVLNSYANYDSFDWDYGCTGKDANP